MVGPIRVDGLFSGIDFTSIIEKLVAVERRPIEKLEGRIATNTSRQTALLDLSARLLAVRTAANTLSRPGFFSGTTVASSDEAAVAASGSQVASTGAFSFQVRSLARSHQLLSGGFADTSTTRVGPGALTVSFGDEPLDRATPLSRLNGGRGVDRGFVRVTDNAGSTAVIDLQGAVTLRDVADAFNASTQVKVAASIEADRLVLQDRTGLAGTALRVDNFGLDTTAADLGLAGRTAVDLGGAPRDVRLFGAPVNYLAAETPVSVLNDGFGVRSATGDDFTIVSKAGVSIGVDIPASAATVKGLLDAVNNDADNAGQVVAAISADGAGLELRDVSGGGGNLTVTAIGASAALGDLGWEGVSVVDEFTGQADPAGTRLTGRRILATLDGVLARSLNGGAPAASASDLFAGVRDGTVRLRNRAGAAPVDVNLSRRSVFAFDSVAVGVLPGVRVLTPAGTPSSFAVGNRILVAGTDGGVGTVLARTIAGVTTGVGVTDLFFDEALPATFTMNAGDAVTTVVEGTSDVVRLLSSAGSAVGISARVNDSGNGLRLTDATSGSGALSVENLRTSLTAAAGAADASVTVASTDGFLAGQSIRLSAAGASVTRTITAVTGPNDLTLDAALGTAFAAGAEAAGLAATDLGVVSAGRAESGTAATFTDNALIGHPEDAFVGATVRLLAGPNAGSERTVTAFDAATGAVTLGGAALALPLDDTTEYRISFAGDRLAGRDLEMRTMGENTLLSSLRGGEGVAAGRIRITDRQGRQILVDLRQSDDTTVGKVLLDINSAASAAGSALVARINDAGDGIVLFDSDVTGTALRVDDVDNGRTARDLNLAGAADSASPQTLDGSFERRIELASASTLDEIVGAINAAGLSVTASILNDGSGATPYRLALLGSRPGRAGRMTVDAQEGLASAFSFTTTGRAEDAVVLFGTDSGANDPALIVSSGNTLTNVVPGLTVDLRSVTSGPVTVAVSRDTEGTVDQVGRLVEAFNDVRGKIDSLTDFDEDTETAGILFGDTTVRTADRRLVDAFTRPVTGVASGRLNTLSQVGIRFDQQGRLQFDASLLRSVLTSKFEETRDLFTAQAKLGIATALADLNGGLGVNVIDGEDLRIFQRDGTAITVDLGGATRAGDVLSAVNINPDNTGDLAAAFSADGFAFTLSDASTAGAFTADAGTSGATLVAAAGSPFDGRPDDFYNGMTLRRSDTGETALVVDFDGAARRFTLSRSLFSGAGDPFAVDLQVVNLNGSRTASDLGIGKVAAVGSSVLTGALRNLANDPGAAPRLARTLGFLTDEPSGLLPARNDSLDGENERLQDDIARMEDRIDAMEIRLVRQFSRLEQFIAASQGTQSQLEASFTNLLQAARSNNRSRRK